MRGRNWSESNNPSWNGGTKIDTDGRLLVRRPDHPNANSDKYVFNSILVAEKALGHILPGKTVVHHSDKITDDQSIVICQDNGYHMLLHARKRIVEAGGNPKTQKICCKCKRLKYKFEFNRLNSGQQPRCRECEREIHRIKKEGL